MYNNVDDNTASYAHKNPIVLKSTLQQESHILLDWFSSNLMQANPYKFQAIAVGKKTFGEIQSLTFANNTIHVNIRCRVGLPTAL